MGYSESLATIEGRKELLGPLLQGKPARWECPKGEERQLAYNVRECFHIARKNPRAYPDLFKAAQRMEVRILGPGLVQAQPKQAQDVPSIRVMPADLSENGEQRVVGLNGIVDEWIAANEDSIRFPQTDLTTEELRQLHAWAQEQGVLIFWSPPAITIKEFDVELAEYAFDPEEDL